MSDVQHSGIDVITALFSDLQGPLGRDPLSLRQDDRPQRHQQLVHREGEGDAGDLDLAIANVREAVGLGLTDHVGQYALGAIVGRLLVSERRREQR